MIHYKKIFILTVIFNVCFINLYPKKKQKKLNDYEYAKQVFNKALEKKKKDIDYKRVKAIWQKKIIKEKINYKSKMERIKDLRLLDKLSFVLANKKDLDVETMKKLLALSPRVYLFLQDRKKVVPLLFRLARQERETYYYYNGTRYPLKEQAIGHLIMVLFRQKKGYGNQYIDESYYLSKKERSLLKSILLKAAKDKKPSMRSLSVEGLQFFLKDPRVKMLLQDIAENDPHDWEGRFKGTFPIRENAKKALKRGGPDCPK